MLPAGHECATEAATPASPERDEEDEPERKKHSQMGNITEDREPLGLSIGVFPRCAS
jgi:hypothetical protein